MKKRGFLIYIFVFLGLYAQAIVPQQNTLDSLKNQLVSETDLSALSKTYSKIAKQFTNNNDSALFYSRKYMQTALETKDSFEIADAYYQIADLYYNYDYDSTLLYVQKYLQESIKTKDTVYIADAYNFLAYAYSQKGELIASLENYRKAFDYFTYIKDSSQMACCYINIGYTISFGKEQTDALKYFLKGLNLSEIIRDTILMCDAYYNVGYYYKRIKDYRAAFDFYKKSLDLSFTKAIPDSNCNALTYADLASVSLKLNNKEAFDSLMEISYKLIPKVQIDYDEANLYSNYIENYIESEDIDSAQHYLGIVENILNKNSFNILQAYTLQQKGRIEFLKKNYEESIFFLDQSIELFMKLHSDESFSDSYRYKSEAYAAMKKFKEAYFWQLKSDSFEDSLNLGAVERVLGEFEQTKMHEVETQRNKLEMELEQQKIRNSNLQIRTKLRLSIAALVILSLLIVAAIFHYRTIRRNNKILSNKNELIEDQVIKLKENEKKLQGLNATKDKFFSIIAHDLRNPFHSIIGLSQLFLDNNEKLDSKEHSLKIIGSMHQTATYGYALLENLLEWSKSQTGNIVPNPVEIHLDQILHQLITSFKAMATSKKISISYLFENTPSVFADKNMVITTVRNLLHNAIKFSYEESTIIVETYVENNKLVTTITDNGVGISEQDLPKLFKIEEQVTNVGTKKEKGSGLGLILCKEFIEKNNGEITVVSKKGEGSTFSFTLPLYS